jgi:transposase
MPTELRRPGVTLELLHLEYLAAHPDGYRYSAFCGHYRRWLARQRTSMRQVHTAGEKTFVDYAGQRPSLVDPGTGAVVPVELFVAVLGASNYTYAEASWTQPVDLTRFSGHFIFTKRGVRDGKEAEDVHAGVPATDG